MYCTCILQLYSAIHVVSLASPLPSSLPGDFVDARVGADPEEFTLVVSVKGAKKEELKFLATERTDLLTRPPLGWLWLWSLRVGVAVAPPHTRHALFTTHLVYFQFMVV